MRGVDNRTGRYHSLVARDVRRIHAMRRGGQTVPEIARALEISTRTVYRYLAAYIVTQTVAGHRMSFLVYPGRRPVVLDEARL